VKRPFSLTAGLLPAHDTNRAVRLAPDLIHADVDHVSAPAVCERRERDDDGTYEWRDDRCQ
jgi:hypothetical protein